MILTTPIEVYPLTNVRKNFVGTKLTDFQIKSPNLQ